MPDDEQVYAYTRTLGEGRMLVVLNWSDERATVDLGGAADLDPADLSVRLSNYDDTVSVPGERRFRPYEAVVYQY